MHPLHQLLIPLYVLSHKEKRDPDAPFLQAVQQLGCAFLMGTVIKCKGHAFAFKPFGPVQGFPALLDPRPIPRRGMDRPVPQYSPEQPSKKNHVRPTDHGQKF